jgi:hypothetical protein
VMKKTRKPIPPHRASFCISLLYELSGVDRASRMGRTLS